MLSKFWKKNHLIVELLYQRKCDFVMNVIKKSVVIDVKIKLTKIKNLRLI